MSTAQTPGALRALITLWCVWASVDAKGKYTQLREVYVYDTRNSRMMWQSWKIPGGIEKKSDQDHAAEDVAKPSKPNPAEKAWPEGATHAYYIRMHFTESAKSTAMQSKYVTVITTDCGETIKTISNLYAAIGLCLKSVDVTEAPLEHVVVNTLLGIYSIPA